MAQSVVLIYLELIGADCEVPPMPWLSRELAQSTRAKKAQCWRTGKTLQLTKDPSQCLPKCSACITHRAAVRRLFDAAESCLRSMPFVCVLCCTRSDGIPSRQLPQWRRLVQLAHATQSYCQEESLGFNMSKAHWDVDADELGDDLLALLRALRELKANYEVRRSFGSCQQTVRNLVQRRMAGAMARIRHAPTTVMPLYSHLRCICHDFTVPSTMPTATEHGTSHRPFGSCSIAYRNV